MDIKWKMLYNLNIQWSSAQGSSAQGSSAQDNETKQKILQQVRSGIDAACTRFLQGKDIELSKDWKKALAGQDPASRKLAQVLQTLHKDPSVFGMIGIDVANDVWMERLLDRLGKTRLLRPFIPFSEADRQAEYFLITWLICVERKDAFLQQAVQRAAKLFPSKQTETGLWENRWDAFDYLAAASLLLIRNTQPTWHNAVLNYRRVIKEVFPEKHLPPPSQWKTGQTNCTRDVLSKDEWLQAFQKLRQEQPSGPESLPNLSELLEENFASTEREREKEDAEFLRQFGGFPSSYQNDYVYMLKNYLVDLMVDLKKANKQDARKGDWTVKGLANVLRDWALNGQKPVVGMKAKKRRNVAERKDDVAFSRLFLPPEWALKREYLSTEGEAEQETTQKGRKKPKDEEQQKEMKGQKKKPATRKAPFRALRYTLFLLMGMQEDRYYGEAGDMRLFLLRLGLACGLSSDGLQRLLLEQKLPGIDFKTAPELILAYEADRSQQAAAQKDVPPIRTTAYAEAELLLRVYRLLIKTQSDKAPSEVRLESTRYMYNEYDKTVRIQGKNIPPRDFLAWMQGQNFPAYTVEQLLSGRYSGGKVVFCCMQLFHTMWFLSHINEVLLEKLSKRTQTRSPSSQRRKKAKREESRKKSAETRELVERLLQQMNNGFSVFRKEETAVCLQKLLDMLPDMQKEEKSHQSLPDFFFPDSDVRKLLLSFFPYDSEFYLESDSKSAPECDPLRNQEVLQLCRCVAERRLLERDDFFYLMFTDFLLTYGKAEDSETYVARFEQMYKETAEECRILPFCAEQEPQMATVFRRAANNYKKYVGNMVVEP